jgi:uncharacterized membrane protein
MKEVIRYVDVDCPVGTVYNQYTQFEEFPRFMSGVKQVKQLDDETLHWVVEIGGLEREFDAKITEQIPDERVAWKSVDGKTHAGVATFHRLDDQKSRVTLQMSYDPEGFAENAADMLGLIGGRLQGDLERFKEFIERRGHESGAWRGQIETPGAQNRDERPKSQ